MFMHVRAGRFAMAMMGLALVACGDDEKKSPADEEVEDQQDSGGGVRRPDAGSGLDASRGLDGSQVDTDPSDSGVDEGDGAVSEDEDASADGIDASQPDASSGPDASKPDASGGNVPDASKPDASQSDAGKDASVSDAAAPCDINSVVYGCGTVLSERWVRFASGLEIDRSTGRGWSQVFDFTTVQALNDYCAALTVQGIDDFEVPEMDDARTLAAGCDKTTSLAAGDPADKCAVVSGVELPSDAQTCSCQVGTPPNNGKFCRADVPTCVTMWTQTQCGPGNNQCPERRFWFYDVTTGSITSHQVGQGLATTAKARCVAGISGAIP